MEKITNFYTPLEEAKKEIWRRWNDPVLKNKVEDYFGANIPLPLNSKPRFVLARHVITLDVELGRFIDFSNKINLDPLATEFIDDTFVTTNPDKALLGKLLIQDKIDKNTGRQLFIKKTIIDLSGKEENKKIKEILTTKGELLVDFHHRMVRSKYPDIEIIDISDFYKQMGGNAKKYYYYLLALFVRNGVLFENFLQSGSEKKFTEDIFFPAFKKIEDEFGVKPLIVEAVPENQIDDTIWWSCPEEVKLFLSNFIWKR